MTLSELLFEFVFQAFIMHPDLTVAVMIVVGAIWVVSAGRRR